MLATAIGIGSASTGAYADTPVKPAPPDPGGVLPKGAEAVSDIAGLVANVFGAGQAVSFLLQEAGLIESNVDVITQQFQALQASLTTLEAQASWGDQAQTCWDDQLKLKGDLISMIEAMKLGQSVSATSTPATDAAQFSQAAENAQCLDRLFADSVTNGNPPQTTDGFAFQNISPPGPLQLIWKDALTNIGFGRGSTQAVDANGYIFDWRLGIPNILEAIAMRLVSIAAIDPNFKTDGVFSNELTGFRTFLQTQLNTMTAGVQCGYINQWSYAGFGQATDPALFLLSCADVNTGLNITQDWVYDPNIANLDWVLATNSPEPTGYSDPIGDFLNPYYNPFGLNSLGNNLANSVSGYEANLTNTMWREVFVQMPAFETQAMINTLYLYINGGQELQFQNSKAIRLNYNYYCLDDGDGTTGQVQVAPCNGSGAQQWAYNRGTNRIQNVSDGLPSSGECLEVQGGTLGVNVLAVMNNCQDNFYSQMWTYDPEKQVILNKLGTVLAVVAGQIDQNPAQLWVEDQANDAYEQWVP